MRALMRAAIAVALLIAPTAAFAQLKVIISGGFSPGLPPAASRVRADRAASR